MKKSLTIIVLLAVYMGLDYLPANPNASARSTVLTGIVLVCAYLLAQLLKNIRLPRLTGYMLLGIALGPVGLNFLTGEMLHRLHFLENLALAFIAITAGGELKFERIRPHMKVVVSVLGGQVLVVFWGLYFLLMILSQYFPLMRGVPDGYVTGFVILFSATAVSKSPATTIGIITEMRARGRMTDIVLSVTVLKSILLVLLFPPIVAWAKLYLLPETAFNAAMLGELALQIGGSIFTGAVVGLLIILYLKYINREPGLFLVSMAILLAELGLLLEFEILLMALITGIIVENFSRQGEALVASVERSSLPLYIIFFSFAGAGLHLETIRSTIWLTFFLVLVRMALIYLGNYIGAAMVTKDKTMRHLSWMGYIGQAGIAVGLATIIERTFPGETGTSLSTILIATVIINELMGPVFFKYLLSKVKEAHHEDVQSLS